jgi:hypothetical protein
MPTYAYNYTVLQILQLLFCCLRNGFTKLYWRYHCRCSAVACSGSTQLWGSCGLCSHTAILQLPVHTSTYLTSTVPQLLSCVARSGFSHPYSKDHNCYSAVVCSDSIHLKCRLPSSNSANACFGSIQIYRRYHGCNVLLYVVVLDSLTANTCYSALFLLLHRTQVYSKYYCCYLLLRAVAPHSYTADTRVDILLLCAVHTTLLQIPQLLVCCCL